MAKQNQKADEKSKSAPKLPDRYLNTVFGNVLDEAVNTSYNLKLYMIKDRTSGGGGYINGALRLSRRNCCYCTNWCNWCANGWTHNRLC